MQLISDRTLKEKGLTLNNDFANKILYNYLKINKINRLYAQSLFQYRGIEFIQETLNKLNITFHINESELKKIPTSGPYIVVANHPFGFLDGILMIHLFAQRDPSFKVLANYFLREFTPIKDYFIDLDPVNQGSKNRSGLLSAIRALKNGNPIGLFPAGEVSTMQNGFKNIEDKPWDSRIIRFITKANVPVIPLYFEGTNSLMFHLLGKIRPELRTASIPGEFFKKQNKTIQLHIGHPIQPKEMIQFPSTPMSGAYIRSQVYALKPSHKETTVQRRKQVQHSSIKTLIEPEKRERLYNEIEILRAQNKCILEKKGFEVYISQLKPKSSLLKEIGRLREKSFREVGEGTNQSIDLDRFDQYYHQLFIWDNATHQVIGGYRLGDGNEIMKHQGIKGFYISTLFHMQNELIPTLADALELGRSFVVKEYQQKPLPLFMLWQGIVTFLKERPKFKYIIGPLSISNNYSTLSKDLMVSYIKQHHFNERLAKYVTSGHAYNTVTNSSILQSIITSSKELGAIEKYFSGSERRYDKIPVLLKQYLKQKAEIIGFNVDPDFNYSLDCLMIQKIDDLPEETLVFLKN